MSFKATLLLFVVSQVQRIIYVHVTEQNYIVIRQHLAKESSATYQIRLWSERGTKVVIM